MRPPPSSRWLEMTAERCFRHAAGRSTDYTSNKLISVYIYIFTAQNPKYVVYSPDFF